MKRLLALPLTVLLAALGADAGAVSLLERTYRASAGVNQTDTDGSSSRPAVSPDGRTAAFDSTAANLDADLNGAVRDVFLRRLPELRTTLVSEGIGGGADGASHSASISGTTVAFTSAATNLVPHDTNGHEDVFVRDLPGAVVRVSQAPDGTQGDGPSGEPDLSGERRHVAFTSSAANLVGQDANGTEDVFVRDLLTGALERISDVDGRAAGGRSRQPAISADGRYVAFASTAPDLVPGDTNDLEDVFVVDRAEDTIELVSVSSGEFQQNAAVAAPFSQISDISADGRHVVFDSDADNLVPGDRNQDTDVFVRDRRRDITRRVSVDTLEIEGDNDSFYPTISGSGRSVVFNSFADNLAPGDAEDEDVFIRDVRRGTTAVVNVTSRGRKRAREAVDQLLQRPAIDFDGDVVGFTSTAGNLVDGDDNGFEDVFVRVLSPPSARIEEGPSGTVRTQRPAFRLDADDRAANRYLCSIDGRPFECRRRGRIPAVGDGTHVLRVRAGGPGMRFEDSGARRVFRVAGTGRRSRPLIRPRVRLTAPKGRDFEGRVVRGRAGGGAGVVRVEVLVVVRRGKTCRFFNGRGFQERACRDLLSVIAEGTRRWTLRLPRSLPKGKLVVVRARAVDRSGNRTDRLKYFRR